MWVASKVSVADFHERLKVSITLFSHISHKNKTAPIGCRNSNTNSATISGRK